MALVRHIFGSANGRLDASGMTLALPITQTRSYFIPLALMPAGPVAQRGGKRPFNPSEGYLIKKIGYITIASDETGGNVAYPLPLTSTESGPARRRRLLRSYSLVDRPPHLTPTASPSATPTPTRPTTPQQLYTTRRRRPLQQPHRHPALLPRSVPTPRRPTPRPRP